MTIIKKFDTGEVVKEKFPKHWVLLTIFFLLILGLIEIWVSNTIVTYGEKFEKIKALDGMLNMENQILENEIAKNASLLSISSKSAELGFSPPQSIQYIR